MTSHTRFENSWLLGIGGNTIDENGKLCMKITDLLGNFMNDAFCCSRATQVLMKTLEAGSSNRILSNAQQ